MLKKIHYISGGLLLIFIMAHLTNHLVSLIGVKEHIALMSTLRKFYYNPLIEAPLLILFFSQIITGIRLTLRKRGVKLTAWEKLQILSGLYLVFFLIVHISAVLIGRYILKLDTNIYFAMAGLNTFPYNLFFIPYYFFASFSLFSHIAAIHIKKTKDILIFTKSVQSLFILVVGLIISCLIIYGYTDGLKGKKFPQEYNILIGK